MHIYTSSDCGRSWAIAYTFAPGEIRHVHNVIFDPWQGCLWILTGDSGPECRIISASCDFARVETILTGSQQTRAAALVPTREGVVFSTDTPSQQNHIYLLDRSGNLETLAELSSSSIYGCAAGSSLFFSTMAEPSSTNTAEEVRLYGSAGGGTLGKSSAVQEGPVADAIVSVWKHFSSRWTQSHEHSRSDDLRCLRR